MPDWVTHVVIGLLLTELLPVKKKSLLLLGTILPDILPKLALLHLFIPLPGINWAFLKAFHTPFVFLLVTLLIVPLFRYPYGPVILWLNVGAWSHFAADATLRLFSGGGQRLLYPLSLESFRLNWIWPEQSYLLFVPLFIVYIFIVVIKRYRLPSRNGGVEMR